MLMPFISQITENFQVVSTMVASSRYHPYIEQICLYFVFNFSFVFVWFCLVCIFLHSYYLLVFIFLFHRILFNYYYSLPNLFQHFFCFVFQSVSLSLPSSIFLFLIVCCSGGLLISSKVHPCIFRVSFWRLICFVLVVSIYMLISTVSANCGLVFLET